VAFVSNGRLFEQISEPMGANRGRRTRGGTFSRRKNAYAHKLSYFCSDLHTLADEMDNAHIR
ncbi:MAG: hypothetical protein SPI56_00270, partial [Alloprevotella sp.]|nr:hypothetical protein [Alloprevotella sp.]